MDVLFFWLMIIQFFMSNIPYYKAFLHKAQPWLQYHHTTDLIDVDWTLIERDNKAKTAFVVV